MIEFGRFARQNRTRRGQGKLETLTPGLHALLRKTRKGGLTVLRKTMRKRMQAKLKEVKQELRRRMHWPVREHYHFGFRARSIARSTLADANEKRDWHIYADLPQRLVIRACHLYVDESIGLEELDEREQNVCALDATIVELCLAVFLWARFRRAKAGIKLHTLLDLRGSIPIFLWITDARYGDVQILDVLIPEPGSIYVFDRAFIDFRRLYRLHEAHATFRHACQERASLAASLLATRRSLDRLDLRPDHHADRHTSAKDYLRCPGIDDLCVAAKFCEVAPAQCWVLKIGSGGTRAK